MFTMIAVSVVLASLSTDAAAAERLPIVEEFGDEDGCKMARGNYDVSDSGEYLTAESHGGWEWSCSFSWISAGEDFGGDYTDSRGQTRKLLAWSVIALCGSDGMAWPELLSIQDMGDSVAIASSSEPSKEPTILKRSPSAP